MRGIAQAAANGVELPSQLPRLVMLGTAGGCAPARTGAHLIPGVARFRLGLPFPTGAFPTAPVVASPLTKKRNVPVCWTPSLNWMFTLAPGSKAAAGVIVPTTSEELRPPPRVCAGGCSSVNALRETVVWASVCRRRHERSLAYAPRRAIKTARRAGSL